MTWQGETFKGKLGFTMAESKPSRRMPPRPTEGSPNVIFIVLDDVGYGHLGCYGSPIETPNIDRLAANGLIFNNFHTTAMCSPTRACLRTGRNHHTNGLGMISELSQGFPGYDGVILPSRGFLSEILHEKGYANFAIGKWHLVPVEEGTMAGPFDRWLLGNQAPETWRAKGWCEWPHITASIGGWWRSLARQATRASDYQECLV